MPISYVVEVNVIISGTNFGNVAGKEKHSLIYCVSTFRCFLSLNIPPQAFWPVRSMFSIARLEQGQYLHALSHVIRVRYTIMRTFMEFLSKV